MLAGAEEDEICGGDDISMPGAPQEANLSFSWYCLAPVASVAGAILDACCDICGLTEEETNRAAARGAEANVRCIIVEVVVVRRLIVGV